MISLLAIMAGTYIITKMFALLFNKIKEHAVVKVSAVISILVNFAAIVIFIIIGVR